MDHFKPHAICPKCTHDVVKVHYCAKDGCAPDLSYSLRHLPAADQLTARTDEHLHRRCDRCNFVWFEKCAVPGTAGDRAPAGSLLLLPAYFNSWDQHGNGVATADLRIQGVSGIWTELRVAANEDVIRVCKRGDSLTVRVYTAVR